MCRMRNHSGINSWQGLTIEGNFIIMQRLTGCGEVWYRAWFGSKRPRVRIPTLRPKIWNPLLRVPDFLLVWWDSKGRHQCAHWCKKVSGGHFFSPWENPLVSGRTPCGCGQKSNLSDLWNPIITPRRISSFPFLRPRPKCHIYKIPFLWYKEQSGFDPNYLM